MSDAVRIRGRFGRLVIVAAAVSCTSAALLWDIIERNTRQTLHHTRHETQGGKSRGKPFFPSCAQLLLFGLETGEAVMSKSLIT